MYTTTHNETSTVNVVEYMILNYDFDISKHNTEYQYSIDINDGGASIDMMSDLPRYTPDICYYYPSIDAPSNGNSRENGYVFGV